MAENPLVQMVTRAQAGDTRAFDCLVHRFQNTAVAYARTLLRDPAAAEDVAQEAFVRAWQELPRLMEPTAFGGWLRRIVFKYCDRIRRSARPILPLSDTLTAPREEEPEVALERADQSLRVHAAVDSLPCAQREATLLYYLTGQSVKEIAAFLELPPSTVKNRLHAARKRLRKELWEMTENILSSEQPSHTEAFANRVLARVLHEFERQESLDPYSADRSLLDQGRTALFALAEAAGNLASEDVHDGFILLNRKRDGDALAALLMRYLGQPLSDSEIAWAYLHLANVLAASGSAAGAVLAHEAFERRLDGKTPRLSANWPFFPVPEGATEKSYAGGDVRLLFLAQSHAFATSYLGVWRNEEYLTKVDTALSEAAPTLQNRDLRFFIRRMAAGACEAAHAYDRSQGYIRQMYALAEEGEDESQQAELRVKALIHDMRLARLRSDDVSFQEHAQEALELLHRFGGFEDVPAWVRGQRHDLACQLVRTARYAMALPLWEANLVSGGQIGGWGWLMHAATVWQTTHDRQRTLSLLREACAHDDRDMAEMFAEQAEFAGVWKDPEFLQAVSRPSALTPMPAE